MNAKGIMAATKYAPEPGTGGWWPEKQGECTVWYHRPPGFEQRFNRHQRAQREQTSVDRNDLVRACGYEVPADRVDVRVMRKDCGIFGPTGSG